MIEFSSQASVFMFDLVGKIVNNHFADKVRSRCQKLYAITHVAQSLYMIMYEIFKMVAVLFLPTKSEPQPSRQSKTALESFRLC